jgi:HD-like signal output (HDOD) protein
MEALLEAHENLPTLPGIAIKILEAVGKEQVNLKKLADIICADPPLSAKVLRLINSAFYGLVTKITSVQHAINLLGVNTIKNLALSFSLIKDYKTGKNGYFNYSQFWRTL